MIALSDVLMAYYFRCCSSFRCLPQADVTLIVGPDMARIPAHKPILQCRSSFFKEALQGNKTELRLEERSSIVKVLLEFMYLGWTEADITPIALELLAAALKFGLDYFGDVCIYHLQHNLTASNVVEAAILVYAHGLHYLYHLCVPVLKANAHRLSVNDLDKLQQEPVLLRKLLLDCCMKMWER